MTGATDRSAARGVYSRCHASQAATATEPSLASKLAIERRTRLLTPLGRLALEPFAPLRRRDHRNIPEGAALVLSNHVSLPDPMFTIAAAARPIHFLATAAAMQDPIIGRVLQAWGSVPKKKFSADVKAIRLLKKWAEVGAMVGSYPEGERSWDGELMPLLPARPRTTSSRPAASSARVWSPRASAASSSTSAPIRLTPSATAASSCDPRRCAWSGTRARNCSTCP